MTLIPVESFVAPVQGHDDLFSFMIPMEAKALDGGDAVVVEENGDLTIEGYAAVWEGDDREGENFVPGAFTRASKAFLNSPAALCFHHKKDNVLGKVLELNEDGKGLRMRARVDGAIATHPVLGTYYHQIKSGTLSGLSVGGFFKRAMIEGKRKIADMDFTEISVTGVPVHTGPSFAVVAGKALMDDVISSAPSPSDELLGADIREDDARQLKFMFEELGAIFDRIKTGVAQRTTAAA